MKISVITPSIRPDGLKVVFESLQAQTFKEFEWLPRLSVPGPKPDLCYQFNKALDESTGELIVFLQDYIRIQPDALESIWNIYTKLRYSDTAYTFPVGKIGYDIEQKVETIKWDWRNSGKHLREIDYHHWEIDFGCISRKLLGSNRFDLDYDSGFGWENVDLAYHLYKQGVRFRVFQDVGGVAFDHDSFIEHPYKHKANRDLWILKKAYIDVLYGESNSVVEATQNPEGDLQGQTEI